MEITKKRRILGISPVYYPHFGGAEKVVYELYKRAAKEFDIDLLAPNLGSNNKFENKDGFNVYRVCPETKYRVIKLIKYQIFFVKIGLKLAKNNKYDIIHCHYTLPTTIAGLILKWKTGAKLIVTEHHLGSGIEIAKPEENPIGINWIVRWILKRADKIVSTGETQDNYLRYLNFRNFETIDLGGDCDISSLSKNEIFKKHKLDKNKKYLLNISRLEPRKKTNDLILGMEKICKERDDIVLFLCGKGSELSEIKNMINRKKLNNNIKVLGFVPDEDIREYRKICSAFVSASIFEGVGIMYLEAFCSKLPLIVRNNLASKAIINDGVSGLLFKSPEIMAKKVLNLIDDNKKMNEFIENGFYEFKTKYNWDLHGKKYIKLYNNVLEKA